MCLPHITIIQLLWNVFQNIYLAKIWYSNSLNPNMFGHVWLIHFRYIYCSSSRSQSCIVFSRMIKQKANPLTFCGQRLFGSPENGSKNEFPTSLPTLVPTPRIRMAHLSVNPANTFYSIRSFQTSITEWTGSTPVFSSGLSRGEIGCSAKMSHEACG